MSLTFIMPQSKQPLALPSHAWSFFLSLEGTPTRLVSQCVQGGGDAVDAVKGVSSPHAVFTKQRQMSLTPQS